MVQVAQRDEVFGGVLTTVCMLLDMMRLKISMVGVGKAVRPPTPLPAARPVIPAHDFTPNDLRDMAIVRRGLLIAHQHIDADWK